MNTLQGKIIKIDCESHLSIVTIDVHGIIFKSIIIETPETAPYLYIGSDIKLHFKETEVVISKSIHADISLRNKMECKVIKIEKGKLLSRLILNTKNATLSSVITTDALDDLKVKEKDLVIAMVKTNEVMLSND